MIEVSIITPCFNLERYIQHTYESLKVQGVLWEWIIVDDGSTDETLQVISRFDDPRVKVLKHAHVGNLAVLRNYGAKHATGQLLAFLDGDDWYTPDGLMVALNHFRERPDIDFAHTDTINYIEATGEYHDVKKRNKLNHLSTNSQYLTRVLKSNPITVSSFFITKNSFIACQGFNEKYKYCEDLELWIRLLASNFRISFIDQPILIYRIRDSSLFQTKRLRYLKTNFQVYRHFFKSHPIRYLTNLKSIILFYSNNYFFIYKCLATHKQLAKRFFWLSVALDPRKLRYVKDL